MKYATLALLGIGLAIGSTIAQGQAPAPKGEPELKTVQEKFAYAYGLQFGRGMKREGVMLNADLIAKGIKDGLSDKAAFTDQELQEIDLAFRKFLMEKQAEKQAAEAKKQASNAGPIGQKNLKDGEAFLAANKSKPGVTTLPSGVQYKVLKSGTGKTSPKLTDRVKANYRGTVIDGTEFDSSYKKGMAIEFGVDEVIPGWTEVLQLMKVGDKWQVFIPSDKAYGPRQRSEVITPNSTLIFEMELESIVGEK
jgi:FKBP-type peptidyl-prolyl cis-trans isomerase FklB